MKLSPERCLIDYCRRTPDTVRMVGLLFRIVLGRSADIPGIAHYVGSIQAGKSYKHVAREMLKSREYGTRGRDPDWWRIICRNAGQPEHPPRFLQSAASYCCELATKRAVEKREGLLPLAFEDGLSFSDPSSVRFFLEQSAFHAPISGSPATCSVPLTAVVFVTNTVAEHVTDFARSIRTALGVTADIVLLEGSSNDRSTRAIAELAEFDAGVSWAVLGTAAQAQQLAACRGDFVLLFSDVHELVTPALAVLGAAHLASADIISLDEDAGEQENGTWTPDFGAAFDPERMQAALPRSFYAIRREVFAHIDCRLPQDPHTAEWVLLLRATARVGQARIAHVPRLGRHRIGHWEEGPPINLDALNDIVRDHLQATGQSNANVVSGSHPRTVRIVHSLGLPLPTVSIVIPTKDRADLLRQCLSGLLQRTEYAAMEILVVDNGSVEPKSLQLLSEVANDSAIRVLRALGPFNWARLNNLAALEAKGELLLFLNNDTDVIHPDWLRELASQTLRLGIGVVGAKLLYPDGTVQHAGVGLRPTGEAYHLWRGADGTAPGYRNSLCMVSTVSAVTGACMCTRKEVWREVGGFEERLPITYSDIDYCLRVRAASYRVIWTPYARLLHLECATRGFEEAPEAWREAALFRNTWGAANLREIYVSPHIRSGGPDLKLAPPLSRPIEELRFHPIAR